MDLLPKEPETINTSQSIEDLDKIQFDFSPDISRGKLVITSHGEKGAGKTYGIFLITTGRVGGFPSGKTNVISFDNKTKITKEQWFNDDDITVWNGKEHYREDPTLCTRSGMISYKYIQKLIQSWKASPPDWIVFDGFTIMALIFEMAMRFKHGLQPSEGIANRNVWKDRARFVQDIHNLATKTAKYGVAYTTYSEKNEIVEAGTVVSKSDVPKYIDVVMQETDVVLHSTKAKGKDGDLFYLRVESTKFKSYTDMDGKPIPYMKDVTLEQGRTFNISKLSETAPKKPKPHVKTATELAIEKMVPPKKEEPKIEPTPVVVPKAPEVVKTPEVVKPVEQPKVEVKPEPKPEIKKEEPVKKKFEVPNLLDI
jgi:hypothetical protein